MTLTWRSHSPLRKSTAQYFFLKSLTLTWREWLSSEEKYCTVLFSQIPDSDLAEWLSSEEKYCTVLFSQIPDSDLARVTLLWGKVLHSTFFSNPWLWLGASDSSSKAQYLTVLFSQISDSDLAESLSSEEKYCTVLFSQIPDSDLARVTLLWGKVLHSTFLLKSLTLTWREWLFLKRTVLNSTFFSNQWLWLGGVTLL